MNDDIMLQIENLHAQIGGKSILKGVNLEINPGELHVIMGPNGSGKSTLAKTLMGHPEVEIEQGSIHMNGEDMTEAEATDRSQAGIFLAFQYPIEVPGVNFSNFLRLAYNSRLSKEEQLPVFKFRQILKQKAEELDIKDDMLDRNLNEGLSGGEKKKAEILQMAMLQPKLAILDETDSGLDIDALKSVFEGVKKLMDLDKEMSVLLITHYQRIFDYITPNKVHLMSQGEIKQTGGMEIVEQIITKGYKNADQR